MRKPYDISTCISLRMLSFISIRFLPLQVACKPLRRALRGSLPRPLSHQIRRLQERLNVTAIRTDTVTFF